MMRDEINYDHRMALIRREAAKLRAEMKGAYLYGLPVDVDDADMMLVAIYYREGMKVFASERTEAQP